MAADPADLDALDAAVAQRATVRTHYDGCYLSHDHRDCAITRLSAELRAARTELAALRARVAASDTVMQSVVDSLAEAGCSGAGVQEHVGHAIVMLRNLRARIALLERVREAALAARQWIHQQRQVPGEPSCCASNYIGEECDCGVAEADAVYNGLAAALDAAKEAT